MSGASPQLAPQRSHAAEPQGRSPLAHLLHALNQPLTGLQCSLELAVASPRRREEYVHTLREGLELAGRMRILVEAIRELADTQPPDSGAVETIQLDALLHGTVEDLLPVAESHCVRLSLEKTSALSVRFDRRLLTALIFRLLESVLSLTRKGSELTVTTALEPKHACLIVSWKQGPAPQHSPFSRQELGLLLVQAGLERGGAEWTSTREEATQTCTVRLPLADCRHPGRNA
jgi:two-component sensor histidine kinase